MHFVDEAVITVTAGGGGRGMASFRKELYVAFGGPDGGDGGSGADVVVVAHDGTTTLLDHRYRSEYLAETGGQGGTRNKTGRSVPELEIPMPIGTVVSDAGTGEIIADLCLPGQRVLVAKGGRGGRGNARFVSSTRQAPRRADPGEPGETRTLRLELKLMADVGVVGLPNAGKSTFLRAVTNSQARVAAYPFTTLVPNLGVARLGDRDIVLADIPGLIEGAHEGQGLGDRFLKHVERTRVLLHLISMSPDSDDPVQAYATIRRELEAHAAELADRPEVVVLNKLDLLADRYECDLWRDAFAEQGVAIMFTSALSGEGVQAVLAALLVRIDLADGGGDDAHSEPAPWSPI